MGESKEAVTSVQHLLCLNLFVFCYTIALTVPFLVPKSLSELEAELEKSEEEKDKRIKFLEKRLLDNGLSINKMIGNIEALTKEMAELREKPVQVKID